MLFVRLILMRQKKKLVWGALFVTVRVARY